MRCYKEGAAFEVEFVTAEGSTVALLTLHRADVFRSHAGALERGDEVGRDANYGEGNKDLV